MARASQLHGGHSAGCEAVLGAGAPSLACAGVAGLSAASGSLALLPLAVGALSSFPLSLLGWTHMCHWDVWPQVFNAFMGSWMLGPPRDAAMT